MTSLPMAGIPINDITTHGIYIHVFYIFVFWSIFDLAACSLVIFSANIFKASLTTSFANNAPVVSTVNWNLSWECCISTASLSSGVFLKSSNVYIQSLQKIHSLGWAMYTDLLLSSISKTLVGQQSTNACFCSSVYWSRISSLSLTIGSCFKATVATGFHFACSLPIPLNATHSIFNDCPLPI